jgi:hypothetical protein
MYIDFENADRIPAYSLSVKILLEIGGRSTLKSKLDFN